MHPPAYTLKTHAHVNTCTQALVALRDLDRKLAAAGRACRFFCHADDDSLLRLDLLVPLLVRCAAPGVGRYINVVL